MTLGNIIKIAFFCAFSSSTLAQNSNLDFYKPFKSGDSLKTVLNKMNSLEGVKNYQLVFENGATLGSDLNLAKEPITGEQWFDVISAEMSGSDSLFLQLAREGLSQLGAVSKNSTHSASKVLFLEAGANITIEPVFIDGAEFTMRLNLISSPGMFLDESGQLNSSQDFVQITKPKNLCRNSAYVRFCKGMGSEVKVMLPLQLVQMTVTSTSDVNENVETKIFETLNTKYGEIDAGKNWSEYQSGYVHLKAHFPFRSRRLQLEYTTITNGNENSPFVQSENKLKKYLNSVSPTPIQSENLIESL